MVRDEEVEILSVGPEAFTIEGDGPDFFFPDGEGPAPAIIDESSPLRSVGRTVILDLLAPMLVPRRVAGLSLESRDLLSTSATDLPTLGCRYQFGFKRRPRNVRLVNRERFDKLILLSLMTL